MVRYTQPQLNKFSLDVLKKIASELELSVFPKSTKKDLINKILASQQKQVGNNLKDGVLNFDTATKELNRKLDSEKPTLLSISNFLIQVNRSNLIDFFSSALIYPVNYEVRDLARSQRTKDTQCFFPNHLLISDGFTDTLDGNQVLIEVSLSDVDKQNLEKLTEFIYLLPYPLPISRVNKIYFANKVCQDNSIATAKTFQDTFLPINTFSIWSSNIPERLNSLRDTLPAKINLTNQLWIDKQNHFNRILGLLAFMKNSELYYTNESSELATYSNKYFKVLNLINSDIKVPDDENANKDISFYSELIKPSKGTTRNVLKNIISAIYENQTFKKDIFKDILDSPSPEIQNAFKLLVNDETLRALEAIDALKLPELTLLTFLYRFRDKEGSDKFALKQQIPYLINRKRLGAERALNRSSIILATMGLYFGYRNLPKDETIKLTDSFFSSFSENGRFNIKYRLDNLLDRITIESVFQYCFFEKASTPYNYLMDDNAVITYSLPPEYDDTKTFSIIENFPIIRISKQLSIKNKRIKDNTQSIVLKIDLFMNKLLQNRLINNGFKIDDKEFNYWLNSASIDEINELEKLIAQFKID